jgi:hypothetical protein
VAIRVDPADDSERALAALVLGERVDRPLVGKSA